MATKTYTIKLHPKHSLYAPRPIIQGKQLGRDSHPVQLTAEQYAADQERLEALAAKKVIVVSTEGEDAPAPVAPTQDKAGDAATAAPAGEPAPEAAPAGDSAAGETPAPEAKPAEGGKKKHRKE